MFRLVGTSVFLGVVLAVLALAATAATVPSDEAAYQAAQVQTAAAQDPLDAAMVVWTQGQPSELASTLDAHERSAESTGATSLPDAHERTGQPTVLVVTDANDRIERPTVVATEATDGIGWTTTAIWAIVGAAVVVGLVVLAIVLLGTPRGHPPLAHH
jgi:hypothetical protein